MTIIASPTEKNLFFLRLTNRENTSFFMAPLSGGQEIELIRSIDVDPEFYGNYLPAAVH
jgi:hypothetical protein